MFNWISQAVNSVAKLFQPKKSSPKPKPTPKPKTVFKPLPKVTFPKLKTVIAPVKYWNNGKLSPQQIAANNRVIANNAAIQRRNAAIAAENKRKAAQRALEQARLKATMQFNQKKMKLIGEKAKKVDALKSSLIQKEYNKAWYGKENPTAYDKIRRDYREKAAQLSKNVEKNRDFLDTLTGGFGAQTRARQFAQKNQAELKRSVEDYEQKVKKHNTELAKKQQRLKWLASNGTQQQYERELNEAQRWLKKSTSGLQYQQASIEGLNEGYGLSKDRPLSGWLAGLGKFLDPKKNPVTGGMKAVWDYTLGSGDKNIPSLVTAPARAVTALTNLGRKKGDKIYLSNGKTVKYDGNAWGTTWGQRNLNIGSAGQTYSLKTDIDQSYKTSLSLYRSKTKPNKYLRWYKDKLPTKEQWLNEKMDNGKTRKQTWFEGKGLESSKGIASIASDTLEFGADPLLWTGNIASKVSRLSKGAKTTAKLKGWSEAFTKSVPVSKLGQSKVGKAVKWLGKEKKSPEMVYAEKSAEYTKRQAGLQDQYFKKYRKIMSKIKDNKYDYSVLDDLERLSDDEAKILQRMTGLNTFALKDRIKLAGSKNDIKRKLLLDIHKRAQSNARLMRRTDKVESDRFVDKYYAQGWQQTPKDKNAYSFRAFRKNSNELDAETLRRAQIERYMQSGVDDVGSKSGEAVTAAQKELKDLMAQFDEAKKLGRPELEAAYKKMNSRGKYLRKALGMPMNVWKASVLALRPAWYVNNKVYNTFAGFNAGGAGYARESVKMLKRGALKQARKDNPKVISSFDKYFESKGNPLWKGASAMEDRDRLAAYKALINKGTDPDEALKQVNKFFFDYKTKNWERPLKTAMPFWAWTKSTGKLAARMPFERPKTSIVLHRNDENNKNEIAKLPKKMQKYYKGRQFMGYDKDGNPRFMNTPFNPFGSVQNFSNVSANPFIAALSEISTQTDYYGNPLSDKTIFGVFRDKFPQPKLAKKAFDAWKNANGDLDTAVKYFSEAGSDGYAYTKERQGTDKSKTNYNKKLDPSSGLQDDILAFLGIPKSSSFNKLKYKEVESLTKLNKEFFSIDWDKKYPDYKEKVAAQEKLAKSYGFDLEKDLYKGLWSKNDSDLTRGLKKQKESARNYLKKFWNDYYKQPYGTKSIWVRDKMKSIVDSGVIATNPFIADGLPDWYTPNKRAKADTAEFWRTYFSSDKATRKKLIADNPKYNHFNYSRNKSQKQIDYLAAKSSGDWRAFTAKYGVRSQKQADYLKAKGSGDWSSYRKKYGDSDSYKRNASQVEAAKFWKKYFASDNATRKDLMKTNPKYNKFKDDTPKSQAEWDTIMLKIKADRKQRAMKNSTFAANFKARKVEAEADQTVAQRRAWRQTKRISWK